MASLWIFDCLKRNWCTTYVNIFLFSWLWLVLCCSSRIYKSPISPLFRRWCSFPSVSDETQQQTLALRMEWRQRQQPSSSFSSATERLDRVRGFFFFLDLSPASLNNSDSSSLLKRMNYTERFLRGCFQNRQILNRLQCRLERWTRNQQETRRLHPMFRKHLLRDESKLSLLSTRQTHLFRTDW